MIWMEAKFDAAAEWFERNARAIGGAWLLLGMMGCAYLILSLLS